MNEEQLRDHDKQIAKIEVMLEVLVKDVHELKDIKKHSIKELKEQMCGHMHRLEPVFIALKYPKIAIGAAIILYLFAIQEIRIDILDKISKFF